jgi:hypothetical protein
MSEKPTASWRFGVKISRDGWRWPKFEVGEYKIWLRSRRWGSHLAYFVRVRHEELDGEDQVFETCVEYDEVRDQLCQGMTTEYLGHYFYQAICESTLVCCESGGGGRGKDKYVCLELPSESQGRNSIWTLHLQPRRRRVELMRIADKTLTRHVDIFTKPYFIYPTGDVIYWHIFTPHIGEFELRIFSDFDDRYIPFTDVIDPERDRRGEFHMLAMAEDLVPGRRYRVCLVENDRKSMPAQFLVGGLVVVQNN